MFELISLSPKCWYVQSPAKIGVVKLSDNSVAFIDSGNDKDAGRKLRQHLDANHWKLEAIYCTHSNADHIGGCQYLQKQTGCKIYAPGIEKDFTAHTLLEPSFLYGAYPFKELRNKFLMAQSVDCQELSSEHLPEGMEAIPLPGHFFDQVGFRTGEGIVFLADCLSSRETLDKYRVGFIYDVGAYLETLEKVKTMDAGLFVPSHAEVTEDIAPLAQYNIDVCMEIAERILEFCAEPLNSEELIRRLFKHYGLTMNIQQHVLVGSTVRSYLGWLKDRGEVEFIFDDEMMLWQRRRN